MASSPHLMRNLATFVVFLALAAGTAGVSLQWGGAILQGDTTRLRALMPTTSALGKGSRVTMAGAQVGRVASVKRQGFATLVAMDISEKSVLPLPVDSRAVLRQRTPVGENYLELQPGRSTRALTAEDVLPIRQAQEYVDVDQVLSVLQGSSRGRARQLVQGLGLAVKDRGAQLNATLGGASKVVREGAPALSVLSDSRRQLGALTSHLGRVSAAVGERDEAVRLTAEQGLRALKAVSDRDDALASTLRELPATLRQVRGTTARLRTVSATAAPVVRDLSRAVVDLRPAVTELRPAAQQGRNVVAALGAATPGLRRTVSNLRTAAPALAKAMPALRGTICQAAPVLRYAEPYTNDVISAIVGLGSASNSYDALGHLIRLSPIVGENSLAGAPDNVTQAVFKLTRAGILGAATPLTWNPYPKPGEIGTATANGKPALSGPKALKDSGYVFPRIQADC